MKKGPSGVIRAALFLVARKARTRRQSTLRHRDAGADHRDQRDQGEEERNDGFHGLFHFVFEELELKMRTRWKGFNQSHQNIFATNRNFPATT
jgi:hypothetical protein